MAEALPPITVFTATDMAPGCRKRTSSFAPTLKPFQLMTTLAVNCWICIVLGLTWETAALPDTTCPPWGSAAAGLAKRSPARAADRVRLRPLWGGDITEASEQLQCRSEETRPALTHQAVEDYR